MTTPQLAARIGSPLKKISFKSSHRRVTLKVSHRVGDDDRSKVRSSFPGKERERYIAPPKSRR